MKIFANAHHDTHLVTSSPAAVHPNDRRPSIPLVGFALAAVILSIVIMEFAPRRAIGEIPAARAHLVITVEANEVKRNGQPWDGHRAIVCTDVLGISVCPPGFEGPPDMKLALISPEEVHVLDGEDCHDSFSCTWTLPAPIGPVALSWFDQDLRDDDVIDSVILLQANDPLSAADTERLENALSRFVARSIEQPRSLYGALTAPLRAIEAAHGPRHARSYSPGECPPGDGCRLRQSSFEVEFVRERP